MKTIHLSKTVDIPAGVTIKVNGRIVIVKGPRGELKRNFKHLQMDIRLLGKKKFKSKYGGVIEDTLQLCAQFALT